MKISYVLTEEDLAAFQVHIMQGSAMTRRGLFFYPALLLLQLLLITYLLYLNFGQSSPPFLICFALSIVAFGGLGYNAVMWKVGLKDHSIRYYKEIAPDGMSRPITVEISDQHLRVDSLEATTWYNWPPLVRKTSGPEHDFIWINAGYAVIIPKAAFADDQSRQVWFRELDQRMGKEPGSGESSRV